MKKALFSSAFILSQIFLFAANPDSTAYTLEVDVKNIVDDKIEITIYPPQTIKNTAIYNMPKIVPGTYAVSDFGRFVEEFKAFDIDGNPLEIDSLDVNRWEINGSNKIGKITYKVNDTFDEIDAGGIFEPGGTNIEADKNVVFNPFGFVGYFDGAKSIPFNVKIIRPESFYGETSLTRVSSKDTTDIFYARDYFELHDKPILYAAPDTASLMVAGSKIAVAVYSSNKTITANDVLSTVEDIFPAAAEYLGGDLPVDQYSILVYLTDGVGQSGSYGALEHNTSTVFVLPEAPLQNLAQTFRDVTAHEFFHIVTPLNIHSEQIDDYDFMNPQMSKHLWLYEGCTEYAAQHVQVKQGLMSMEDFLSVMRQKMERASSYNSNIAFTEMSKKALDEHADQYQNVYQQGALIGMAVDLELRHLSDGAYGIQNLMRDLAKKYGQDKPFDDDSLFEEIGKVSGYSELTTFLEKHVGDTEPLPYKRLLGYAGINYDEALVEETISGGNLSIGYNPRTEVLVIANTNNMDEFGQEMGFKVGDEFISWNGVEINIDNFQEVIGNFKKNTEPGDKVKILVRRTLENGKIKEKKLKAKAISVEVERHNVMEPAETPSPEQLKIRKAWINV